MVIAQRKIGLYGGSFDPIHFGHLNLALEIQERCGLDEVWFIPAACSPLKDGDCASATHRLNMVNLAIKPLSQFRCLSLEIERGCPSYTIDTLNYLIEKYPKIKFYLILGEDALLTFDRWKSYEEICKKIPLLIGCRQQILLRENVFKLPMTDFVKKSVQDGLVETVLMDISATSIRTRLKSQLFCGHLIPSKVLDYICQYQLYC